MPEAEAAVAGLRARGDPSASAGVPAHITILVPFMAAERITAGVIRRAEAALGTVPPFPFVLGRVCRWPETTFLLPEPSAPFVRLTQALVEAFPDFPPYGGKYADIVPHLTVADANASLADEAESELRAILESHGPIASTCRAVELIENSSGLWRRRHVIML